MIRLFLFGACLFFHRQFFDFILNFLFVFLFYFLILRHDLFKFVLPFKVGYLEFFIPLVLFHQFLELWTFLELKALKLEKLSERVVLLLQLLKFLLQQTSLLFLHELYIFFLLIFDVTRKWRLQAIFLLFNILSDYWGNVFDLLLQLRLLFKVVLSLSLDELLVFLFLALEHILFLLEQLNLL